MFCFFRKSRSKNHVKKKSHKKVHADFTLFRLESELKPVKEDTGAASHEHSPCGSCLFRPGGADLCGGGDGWQGGAATLFVTVEMKCLETYHTRSIRTISNQPLLFPNDGFMESLSFAFLRLLFQVVLDTFEVYDIAKKAWLPPQRLGRGDSDELAISAPVHRYIEMYI